MNTTLSETQIATIPGQNDGERLAVVHILKAEGGSQIELRQQSWGEGVGWFTQNRLPIEPHQLSELRNSLGSSGVNSSRPATPRRAAGASFLRIARADSA